MRSRASLEFVSGTAMLGRYPGRAAQLFFKNLTCSKCIAKVIPH